MNDEQIKTALTKAGIGFYANGVIAGEPTDLFSAIRALLSASKPAARNLDDHEVSSICREVLGCNPSVVERALAKAIMTAMIAASTAAPAQSGIDTTDCEECGTLGVSVGANCPRCGRLISAPQPSQPVEAGEVVADRAPKVPVPTDVLEARAQGRAEALAIILQLSAETGLDEYTRSYSAGDTGDYDTEWDADKLRELLRADDSAWSLMQEAEGEYWHNLGLREEAERNYSRSQSAVVLDDERAAFEVQYERALGHKPERSYASYPHENPDGYESSHANSAWKWWKWSWQARAASPQATATHPAQTERALTLRQAMTPFGMLVRALRIVAGTTLYDMAKHLSCTPAALSSVEFGRKPLTDAMVEDAATYFSGRGIQDTLHALKAAAQPELGGDRG